MSKMSQHRPWHSVSPTSFPTFLAYNGVWILFGCFRTKTRISYVCLSFGKKCCPDVIDVGNLAMNSWLFESTTIGTITMANYEQNLI